MEKRDLKADLELCEKTKPISDEMKKVLITRMARSNMKSSESTRLILEAIDGWPHTLERAIRAERLNDMLVRYNKFLATKVLNEQKWAEQLESLVRELATVTETLLQWWQRGYVCKECPNPSGPASTCISECCDVLNTYKEAECVFNKVREALRDET